MTEEDEAQLTKNDGLVNNPVILLLILYSQLSVWLKEILSISTDDLSFFSGIILCSD